MAGMKSWLAGLDMSEIDSPLAEYVSFMGKLLSPDKIYFVNVMDDLEMPDDADEEMRRLYVPQDEQVEQQMHEKFSPLFEGQKTKLIFDAIHGRPLKEFLDYCRTKRVELIFVGRKLENKGSGILAQKIARRIPGLMMFVPAKAKASLDTILVPTDFSDNSLQAAKDAITLSRRAGNKPKIRLQHIYHVPTGYHASGKSLKSFATALRNHAEKSYAKFLGKLDHKGLDIKPEYTLGKRDEEAKDVMIYAKRAGADMIVVGARGRSNLAAMLLGSTTEKLLRINDTIPTLVVKKPGEKISLLDAIRRM